MSRAKALANRPLRQSQKNRPVGFFKIDRLISCGRIFSAGSRSKN